VGGGVLLKSGSSDGLLKNTNVIRAPRGLRRGRELDDGGGGHAAAVARKMPAGGAGRKNVPGVRQTVGLAEFVHLPYGFGNFQRLCASSIAGKFTVHRTPAYVRIADPGVRECARSQTAGLTRALHLDVQRERCTCVLSSASAGGGDELVFLQGTARPGVSPEQRHRCARG